jgi:hypothetical protein
LQEDEDAEITARRREEEDEALQNQGYGISGTTELSRRARVAAGDEPRPVTGTRPL